VSPLQHVFGNEIAHRDAELVDSSLIPAHRHPRNCTIERRHAAATAPVDRL
jgi:hypothetical protein